MKRSDVPPSLPPRFVILRLAVPARAPVFARLGPTPAGRPELCGVATPRHLVADGRRLDLSSSWGTLMCLRPALRPRRDRRIRPYDAPTRPPLLGRRRLPATAIISGLNHTASALAVYASSPRSPTAGRKTRFPLLASSTARDWLPAGFHERFQECSLHPVLLSKASLTQRNAVQSISARQPTKLLRTTPDHCGIIALARPLPGEADA